MKTVKWLGYGGVALGFVAALAVLTGYGSPGIVDGVSVDIYQGLMLTVFSSIGLIGTVGSINNPRRSGRQLIAAALGGLITAPLLFAVPGLMLLAASTLVLLSQRK